MNQQQTAIQTSKHMRTVFLIATVTAVGGFLFGFDNGAISGSVGNLITKFDLSPAGIGWVTSSIIVGCILGVIISGRLSDAIGRKKVLVGTAIIFLCGAFGEAVAPNASMLVAARILVGIGIGTETTIAPLYIAEVSPARIRGRLVSFNQLFNTVGNLVVFALAAVLTAVGTEQWGIDHSWRWIFAAGLVPAVVFLLLLRLIPESPRWLVRKGLMDRAWAVLRSINPDEATATKQFTAMKLEAAEEENSNWRALLTPAMRKTLVIGFGCALFQQITGINAIIYYAPEIFKAAGLSVDASMMSMVVTGAALVIGTLLSMWLVDKVGRRTLLIAGAGLQLLFHLAIGTLFRIESPNGTLLLFLVVGYVLCYATTFGAVAYVVISEIFPTHVRGLAVSISTFALWGGNFLVSLFFPILVDTAGSSTTFYVFAGTSLLAFIFSVSLVPETKGRTLEEIYARIHRAPPKYAEELGSR